MKEEVIISLCRIIDPLLEIPRRGRGTPSISVYPMMLPQSKMERQQLSQNPPIS